MNFLALVQDVAQKSGTVSGTQPSTVTGQTGRLSKLVNFTADAWDLIQNHHASWRWMRRDFSVSITAANQRYSASSLSITDWASWIMENNLLTIYKTSSGQSDETEIMFVNWSDFRRMYIRGAQEPNRPTHWSISPAGELAFGPFPDDTYTVRGEYMKGTQRLAADSDIPECPVRFHLIVVYRALLLLAEHDEANLPIATERLKYMEMLSALEADQLPIDQMIKGAGPLA